MKMLVFVGYFLPGYKGGGPIRTIANMADRLSDYYTFKIITLDRDLGDIVPYPGIKQNTWNQVGEAMVYYLNPSSISWKNFKRLMENTSYDLIYLNSFFSLNFSIKPLILRKIGVINKKTPIILAPRGEFSLGAIHLKSFKKKIFLLFSKVFGLYNDIVWQASSEFEKEDIKRVMGKNKEILIAPDMPSLFNEENIDLLSFKSSGYLKCVFLSRISPMKNLKYALELLKSVKGQVEYNIYGPIEDKNYWNECLSIIKGLPENITVTYIGVLAHHDVFKVFTKHHLFLFPTLGENFGHVIIESLTAGCPVIISDRTPWKGLEMEGVGWDLPLNKPELFQKAIQQCINMDENEFRLLSRNAKEYGINKSNDDKILEANRNLFLYAVENFKKRDNFSNIS
jgi:glycosyltransferase involved in cell wall biosynthesis